MTEKIEISYEDMATLIQIAKDNNMNNIGDTLSYLITYYTENCLPYKIRQNVKNSFLKTTDKDNNDDDLELYIL